MAFTGALNKKRDDDENKYKSTYFQERSKASSQSAQYKSRYFQERAGYVEPEVAMTKRGIIDRTLGTIGNNSIVEALYNVTDKDDSTSIGQGLIQGLQYMNPTHDDVSNRHSFSDVLKNIGWEDEDPDKLSVSDVGRGVVGFVGDVMLDPITYINPFSAAAKVVKGSGVTADGIKQLQRQGIINDVSDLTKGEIGKSKLAKLTNLTRKEAEEIVGSFKGNEKLSPEELAEKTDEFINDYASKIEKIRNADEGYGLGFGLNFASKKKAGDKTVRFLTKELVSSSKLRRLGDNTISPYYNSLAKKLRVSNLGQKFSTLNKTEAIGVVSGKDAFKRFYTEDLLKAFSKIPLDLDDMKIADEIQQWWDGLTEKQKYDWLISYENGDFDAAIAFLKLKGKIIDKYGEEVSKADDIFNSTDGIKSNIQERAETFNKMVGKFLDDKRAKLSKEDQRYIVEYFGEDVSEMADYDLITALRFADKMKKSSFRDLMNYYNNSYSKYSQIRGKLVDFETEKSAMAAFKKLDLEDRKRLVNEFYSGKTLADERAEIGDELFDALSDGIKQQPMAVSNTEEVIQNVGDVFPIPSAEWHREADRLYGKGNTKESFLKRKEAYERDFLSKPIKPENVSDNLKYIFDDESQSEFYERIGKLFEGDYIKDFAYLGSELKRIAKGASKSDFDDKSLEIAELISKRMDEAAQKEVERGLLKQGQADALKGKYLFHMTTEEKAKLNTLLHEDQNGRFNPDILGILKHFDKRRDAHSIASVNLEMGKDGKPLLDGDGNYVFKMEKFLEDSLHEIYLSRTLASNKLVYGTDAQNFIKHNFGKKIEFDDKFNPTNLEEGYTVVAPYKELERSFRELAMEDYENAQRIKVDDLPEFKREAAEAAKNKSVEDFYQEILDWFADGDENWKVKFSPNVPMQPLTPKQLDNIVSLFGENKVEPFQIQSSILDRTNVLSRTQKVEMANSMLNLFDRMQNIWKLQNTVVHPGFHGQNTVSNLFQSFLGIGADAINPRKLKIAYHIFKLKDPKQTITLGGKTYTYKELEHIAKKTGILDEMFHKYEFNYGGKAGKLEKLGIPHSLDPTNIDDFKLYKWGTTVGTEIEGTARLNMFMSALDQGKSIPDAVETVNKFLFDYSALTEFEQETMKRIIPFYTFMRKNIPMELEQMLMQPTTFTSMRRAQDNISRMNEETYQNENERNEWRQDGWQIPVTIDGKNYGVNDVLPYTQLERMEPNKLAGQTSPFLKIPVELARGETLFTEMPIDNYGQYFANQIQYPKMFNMAKKKDAGWQRNLYILGQALGVPINEMVQMYDYDGVK